MTTDSNPNNSFLDDSQIDLNPLLEKTIAIIGYGSQGRSHALNLKDSGCRVLIGQRQGAGFDQAAKDGFQPMPIAEACEQANVVSVLLPDEIHGPVFESEIKNQLRSGDHVVTCHGFSLHYNEIKPPEGIATLMVAPKGAGHRVRSAYVEGGGVPCLVALGPGAVEEDLLIALAYAKGLGGGRVGVLQTTIREETETDLFGEQVVLCGGVSHLVQAAFKTLVDAGYSEDLAYFECVHELKLVVDLLHKGGLAFMRDHISNTAEYGDYTQGPRVIGNETKQAMATVLKEIQDGEFARAWLHEAKTGSENLKKYRERDRQLAIEKTGQRLIAMIDRKNSGPQK